MSRFSLGRYTGSAYYALRPGITGIWQVTRRNLSSFADRAWYDTQYHRELTFDVRFVTATWSVYIRRKAGHRPEKLGKVAMELIEVQTGIDLGEVDITRH
ncbi:sugar transferase, partial [Cereibacter sphaeroides]